jgi:hypothetical protein
MHFATDEGICDMFDVRACTFHYVVALLDVEIVLLEEPVVFLAC